MEVGGWNDNGWVWWDGGSDWGSLVGVWEKFQWRPKVGRERDLKRPR